MSLWKRIVNDVADGPLAGMLVMLTFASGTIDAVSYLRLGHVFVDAMTGNLLFLGFGIAGAHGISAINALIGLASFVSGSFIGVWLVDHAGSHRGRLLSHAASVQLVALVIATVAITSSGDLPGPTTGRPLIALLGLAMGIQMTVTRNVGIRDVTTTVLTTTLSTLFADLRTTGASISVQLRSLAVIAEIIGAIIGAMLVLHVATWAALALAAVIEAVIVVAARWLPRNAPSWVQV